MGRCPTAVRNLVRTMLEHIDLSSSGSIEADDAYVTNQIFFYEWVERVQIPAPEKRGEISAVSVPSASLTKLHGHTGASDPKPWVGHRRRHRTDGSVGFVSIETTFYGNCEGTGLIFGDSKTGGRF